jgi:hypothetical protein
MSAPEEPSERLVEQRLRNRAMEALEAMGPAPQMRAVAAR